jgi:hypothetical protein
MGRLDVDRYLARRFDLARQNCWHLVRDGWLELTGRDLGDRTPELLTAAALRGRFDSDVPAFEELPSPAEPSIVLMRRPRAVPHVGLYYRARVLQMTPRGASYLPLPAAIAGFPDVRFYR